MGASGRPRDAQWRCDGAACMHEIGGMRHERPGTRCAASHLSHGPRHDSLTLPRARVLVEFLVQVGTVALWCWMRSVSAVLPAGMVLWAWDADPEFGEAAGEQWLALLPQKWNPPRQLPYGWRYDPREFAAAHVHGLFGVM